MLFNEEIQARLHGLVCPKLYEYFKEDEFDLCATEQKRVMTLFSRDIKAYRILSDVWSHFGKYNGVKLENMTHQETPWIDAICKGNKTQITLESMYEYFVQFVQ